MCRLGPVWRVHTRERCHVTTAIYLTYNLFPPRYQSNTHTHRCRGRYAALEPVALTHGSLAGKEGVLARIHDQCLTSEVFGSKRCDCKEQLGMALDRIREEGGVVIYLQQEGRGIGLANKVRMIFSFGPCPHSAFSTPLPHRTNTQPINRSIDALQVAAYALQDEGLDTVDANRHLGFGDDERTYDIVPSILQVRCG